MKNNRLVVLVIVVVIAAVVSFSAGYFLSRNGNFPLTNTSAIDSKAQAQTSPAPANSENPFMPGAFAADASDAHLTVTERVLNIFVRLLLAVILSAMLAFRPRRNAPLFQRNLSVAQTEILLAVVASALMIIVGDNTARAFAIFAAVSLVRFRTNIKDPKEITVLLVSLALGLATGVGRWELGLFLCLFVLVLLWVLEYNESEQIYRSMELTVKTKNTEHTQQVLKKVFARNRLETEVRALTPPDEKTPVGCIMYYMNLRLSISTDRLSDQILHADEENIDGIQWKQEKNIATM